MSNRLTYLAAPYSHKEHHIRVARFMLINKYAAKLMAEGRYLFSPISHTHPIAEAGVLPCYWLYWEGYDRVMIECCDDIIVLRLPGWETSIGVQAEIKISKELEIPIEYVDYELTPTIEDMVKMAMQIEIGKATMDGNRNANYLTTFSSAYGGQGVCINATNVCALPTGLLHIV